MTLPSTKTICAVIITYNPDQQLLKEVDTISKQVSEVIIVDNASSEKKVLDEIKKSFSNVNLLLNTTNEGIAAALNKGIETAIQKGYSWVLQLDQDSIPSNDLVSELCRCTALFTKDNLAMTGCNYFMNDKPLITESNNSYHEVTTLITSGSLLSLEAFQKVGGYREDFFIDGVDFEYSLRLKKKGFHSIITNKPLMHHSIGSLRTVNFGLFKLHSTNHNPVRRYYRARNTMQLTKQYFTSFPLWIIKYNFFLLLSSLLTLLLEKEKGAKLKAVVKGIKDGIIK